MRQDTKKLALATGSSGMPPLEHGEQCSRFGPLAARSRSNSGKRCLRPDRVAETIKAHPQAFFMKNMTRVIRAALLAAFFVAIGFAAAAALHPPTQPTKGRRLLLSPPAPPRARQSAAIAHA